MILIGVQRPWNNFDCVINNYSYYSRAMNTACLYFMWTKYISVTDLDLISRIISTRLQLIEIVVKPNWHYYLFRGVCVWWELFHQMSDGKNNRGLYALDVSLIVRFMGPTRAHLGPTGPRWAPCWHHELCYLGTVKTPITQVSHAPGHVTGECCLWVLIQLRCRANIISSKPFCCITVEL